MASARLSHLSKHLPPGLTAFTLIGITTFKECKKDASTSSPSPPTLLRDVGYTLLPPTALRLKPPSSWRRTTQCEAPEKKRLSSDPADYAEDKVDGAKEEEGLYHGLFPRRQLWRPHLEYPLWDYDWDGRQPPPLSSSEQTNTSNDAEAKVMAITTTEAQRDRHIRKHGITRHIILIRHGQYDETHPEDSLRILTPLGRQQAALTGKRIGEYVRGINKEFGPCHVKVVRVSDLERAKETAGIVVNNLGLEGGSGLEIEIAEPDALLNEGRPCHHIPGGKARQSVIDRTDEHHPRIENAFRKYFYRAPVPSLSETIPSPNTQALAMSPSPETPQSNTSNDPPSFHPQHEFELIICHANVIRYFFCRALQLPPEAWLRLCVFNCSLTYFTIRPTGTVSCRMLGDVGHLPYGMCTFSMHTGFNW